VGISSPADFRVLDHGRISCLPVCAELMKRPILLCKTGRFIALYQYCSYDLRENSATTNTVTRRHANIRKALQYAFKIGIIDSNPADRVERPKKNKFTGSIYNEKELELFFELVKDKPGLALSSPLSTDCAGVKPLA